MKRRNFQKDTFCFLEIENKISYIWFRFLINKKLRTEFEKQKKQKQKIETVTKQDLSYWVMINLILY